MGAGRTLEETESWRTAIFWGIFLFLSIVIETVFHHLEHYLEHKKKKGILGAVHKIKEELMLMGFISLILLAFEDQITWICVKNLPLRWIDGPNDWAAGPPCCTLGDKYWEHLPQQYKGSEVGDEQNWDATPTVGRRRTQEEYLVDRVDYLTDQVQEGFSRRRLGAANLHTSLLRESCPSVKYVTGLDSFYHPVMPPVPHPFDCPANGIGSTDHPSLGAMETGGFVSTSFMDPQALHHVHTLIFLTACWHVIYTAIVMMLSAYRINAWSQWEYYGDDPDEDVTKLKSPMKIDNPVVEVMANMLHQFVKTVDPFTYIAIRRFYIVRNNMVWDFDFNTMCIEQQDRDFAELVGIEPWMWLILVTQFIIDGYTNNMFLKTIGTWLAMVLLLVAGTKLMGVFREIVYGVADAYDDERDGSIEKEDLDRLQGQKIDPHQLDHLNPTFWKGKPKILLQMLRFSMFQFSVNLAELTFYSWQIGYGDACYFMSRPIWPLMIILVILTLVMMGLVTVPLYSLVSMTVHHVDFKPKQLIKKFAVHKKLHMADIAAVKRQLGIHDKRDIPVPEKGWKAKNKPKIPKEKDIKDPEAAAVHKAKTKIRGTLQWATHCAMLQARIDIAKLELQSAQRLQAMNADQKKQALETAKREGQEKAAQLKAENAKKRQEAAAIAANQVAPEPADVEGGTHKDPESEEKSQLVEHEDTAAAEEHHDTHSHGDRSSSAGSHGDHHGGHGGPPWPLIINTFLLLLFCVLLGLVTVIYPYAGKYPSKHWSYAGASGPAWWGTVKPKYEMCLSGDVQDPIDINLANGPGEALKYHPNPTNNTEVLGHNVQEATAPEDVLQFMLDPYFVWNATDEVYGATFNPTQNHRSPRFDCGPGKINAKKGKCGHMYWNEGEDLTEANVTKTKYNLEEFHFHSPSEHTIDGKRFPMELQVVFCTGNCNQDGGKPYDKSDNDLDYSGTQADDSDKFAVYSVLFEAGDPNTNSSLQAETATVHTMWDYMQEDCPDTRDKFGYDCPKIGDYCDDVEVNEETCPAAKNKIKLRDLIKLQSSALNTADIDGESVKNVFGAKDFYTWMGSITTPPCIEGVRWFLQKETAKVPMVYLQKLWNHIGGHPGNARPLQHRNGRNISGFGTGNFVK